MRLTRLLACLVALSLPAAAFADITDGNDPTVVGTQVDGCTNCSFILADPFSQAGATVTSYSFDAFYAGRDLTPVLFTGVDNGNGTTTFTVSGVGATVTPSTTGLQTYSFNLQSGSAITGADTFFGFTDTNGGVVAFNYGTVPDPMYLVAYGFLPSVGNSTTMNNSVFIVDTAPGLNNRIYSIDATAITPEPSFLPITFPLLALGCAAVLQRRRLTTSF